jgi:small subunit ribosomal protein S6
MNNYELLVIIQGGIVDADIETALDRIATTLTENGATIESTDKWGTRKFAYPINYKNEGYYVLYKLTAPADCPSKVENKLNITENIVRSMFIRI